MHIMSRFDVLHVFVHETVLCTKSKTVAKTYNNGYSLVRHVSLLSIIYNDSGGCHWLEEFCAHGLGCEKFAHR